MEILSKQPTVKGPAEMFTGDVWFDVIAKGEPPSRLRVNTVRFAPGARTAWHSHAVGQTLYVTEGRGLAQSRGGKIIELLPGDSICTPSQPHPTNEPGSAYAPPGATARPLTIRFSILPLRLFHMQQRRNQPGLDTRPAL